MHFLSLRVLVHLLPFFVSDIAVPDLNGQSSALLVIIVGCEIGASPCVQLQHITKRVDVDFLRLYGFENL